MFRPRGHCPTTMTKNLSPKQTTTYLLPSLSLEKALRTLSTVGLGEGSSLLLLGVGVAADHERSYFREEE